MVQHRPTWRYFCLSSVYCFSFGCFWKVLCSSVKTCLLRCPFLLFLLTWKTRTWSCSMLHMPLQELHCIQRAREVMLLSCSHKVQSSGFALQFFFCFRSLSKLSKLVCLFHFCWCMDVTLCYPCFCFSCCSSWASSGAFKLLGYGWSDRSLCPPLSYFCFNFRKGCFVDVASGLARC